MTARLFGAHSSVYFSDFNADFDHIPLQLPADDEVLLNKLREESRAVFLQRKSRELLDNEELQVNKQH